MALQKDFKFYLKLFSSTFALSSFTFGGGYVIVPLMKKKFVDQYHWIENEEMLDMVAIAQSSPGPIAINAAILVGYRLGGVLGAAVAILGTILPPLIFISLLSIAYTFFKDSKIVRNILKGMQAGVAAVIVDVVISMSKGITKDKKVVPILAMITAFVLTYFLHVNVILIILVSGVIGGCSNLYQSRKSKSGDIL